MNLDRRLLGLIRNVKFSLGTAVLCAFLAGLAVVFQARQLSQIIARVFLQGQGLAQVSGLLWLLLGSLAARALFTFASETAAAATARQVKGRLRELLTRRLMDLGPAYAQGERSGELANTVTQGIEAIDAYFSQYLPQLGLAGLLPLAFLAFIFPLDPLSAVVLLLTGPLIPFFMFLIGSQAQHLTGQQWKALGRMSAYFLDTLQGLRTLKALGRSREQAGRIAQISERYRVVTMSVLRITFLSALALELLGTIGTAIIAVEVGLRLLYGGMGFEVAFFILLLAPEFYQPLRALGLRFHASMSGVAAARRIYAVLEEPQGFAAVSTATQVDGTALPPASCSIELDSVSFTYPGRAQPALEGVSMVIPPGQTTALVGPSGAGKSTLVHLLLGFISPDQGAIRAGGLPLSALPPDAWRAGIAWVPQRPYLFHGTIAENMRVASPQAGEEDLRRAARNAHLDEFIGSLPDGYDTLLGEDGAKLSAGQAQRLALARAFLRDAPLVILDEPTAHLDAAHELLLQESTARLCAGRTVLVIAHRLSTVAQADQIVVMEGGRVVERGLHADLLARNGAYTRLFRAYQGLGAAGELGHQEAGA